MPLFVEFDSYRLAELCTACERILSSLRHCLGCLSPRNNGSLRHRELCAWACSILDGLSDGLGGNRWSTFEGPPTMKASVVHSAHQIVAGQFSGQLSYDWKLGGVAVRLSAPKESIEG